MQLLLTSMLCNDSSIAEGKELGDPTETALINIGSKLGVSYETERAACSRVGEIPFDSDRKLMSTCNRISGERAAFFERAEKSDVAEGQDLSLIHISQRSTIRFTKDIVIILKRHGKR